MCPLQVLLKSQLAFITSVIPTTWLASFSKGVPISPSQGPKWKLVKAKTNHITNQGQIMEAFIRFTKITRANCLINDVKFQPPPPHTLYSTWKGEHCKFVNVLLLKLLSMSRQQGAFYPFSLPLPSAVTCFSILPTHLLDVIIVMSWSVKANF